MEQNTFADRYARFVLKHRFAVIVFLLISTLQAALYIKDVNLRNDPDSLLPLSNRYVATNLYTENRYGMGNIMVWGFKVKDGDIFQPWFLGMLDKMFDEVSELEFSNRENFIGLPSPKLRHMGLGEDGSLDFKRLMPTNGFSEDPQELREQIEFLKSGLQKHPVLEPLLVYYEDAQGNKCELMDDNGLISNESHARTHDNCQAKATFIIGDFDNGLKEEYLTWIDSVNGSLASYERQYGDRVEFLISGEPYFLASMVEEIRDKAWLFGISLLIIVAVLWYEFRHWTCAVIPMFGVGMTIVLTLGLMGYTQFKLTTMMVLTPMLLLAIGIGHAMQITRRFTQELHCHGDPKEAAYHSIRHTMIPAFLSIGTDLHGFFAISFVDISFYKAYAYFGIFGMSTLILTTTTMIPLLLTYVPPDLRNHEDERAWEQRMGNGLARLLTGPLKWIPLALVIGILWLSAHYAELGRGVSALLAGEAGRSDPEIARIQDEFDIMPGAEKGIHYPRAAFKDEYLLGRLFGDGKVRQIHDLERFSEMMPGAITANLVIRSRRGVLPACGLDSRNESGERIIGPDQCHDELDDPPQGIFNKPEVLSALSNFEDWLRSHPHVGYSTSYIQFVKTINMMLNTPAGERPMKHMNLFAIPSRQHMLDNRYAYADPDDPDYLPNPAESVQMYNALLLSSTSPGELDSFVNTTTWDEGVIVSFINTMDPVETHRTVVDIQTYLREHANDPGMVQLRVGIEAGEQIEIRSDTGKRVITTQEYSTTEGKAAIGGFLGITEATRDVAFAEWLHAPAMTSLTVFLMTAVMFRSWSIAFVLIALCFITLMSQYGLAGYLTSIKEWSANLAFHVQVALSIAMGLGIDYSVYMVSRLREEMRATGLNWRLSLQKTLSSTGSAIVISVVVLLGSVIPLMNTTLANTWSVSLYIAEALILDVITALLFLPLLIYWLQSKVVFQPRK
jgi:predicted RND superfamily exporter protein